MAITTTTQMDLSLEEQVQQESYSICSSNKNNFKGKWFRNSINGYGTGGGM